VYVVAVVCAVLAGPASVAAQLLTSPFSRPESNLAAVPPVQEPATDPGSQMSTSGFFLGVVGMLGGAAVGSGVGNARCGKECVGRSASVGAAIAGSLAVPIGVHIAAARPQNLVRSLAVSVAAGTAVWLGFNAIPGKPVALAPFVAAPLQVWTSMKIEMRGR
jgi:hypothetical protein